MYRYARWLPSVLIPAAVIVLATVGGGAELYAFAAMWLIFQPLAFLPVLARRAGRWYGSRTADATN